MTFISPFSPGRMGAFVYVGIVQPQLPMAWFMMSGLLQVKTLLLTAGVVYLIGQLYVTNKYVKSKMQ